MPVERLVYTMRARERERKKEREKERERDRERVRERESERERERARDRENIFSRIRPLEYAPKSGLGWSRRRP